MSQQRIQFRRDTSGAWALNNPVLSKGEPGYETDTKRWKIGDGTLNWLDLPFKADTGPQGPVGPQGLAGPQGATGPQGQQGPQGSAGNTGSQGIQGPAGEKGETGSTGPQGIQGPKGDAAGINIKGTATTWPPDADPQEEDLWLLPDPTPDGTPAEYDPGDGVLWNGSAWQDTGPIRGETGPQGPAGTTGATGGVGPQGATGPAGPQGPAGTNGTNGQNGADATNPAFSIGTVTAGTTPAVTLTGVYPNLVLNFVLPQSEAPTPNPSFSTVFTTNPQNTASVIGESVTLTASAQTNDTNLIYQWQKQGIDSWVNIPGAGSTSYSPDTSEEGNFHFRCVATTDNTVAYSASAVLTVTAVPQPDGLVWANSGFTRQDQAGQFGYRWSPFVNYLKGIDDAFYTTHYRSLDGVSWTQNEFNNTSGTSEAWSTNLPMHYIENTGYTNGLCFSSNGQNFATPDWLNDNHQYFYSATDDSGNVLLSMTARTSFSVPGTYGIYYTDFLGGTQEPIIEYTAPAGSGESSGFAYPDLRYSQFGYYNGLWVIADGRGIFSGIGGQNFSKVQGFDRNRTVTPWPAFLITNEPDAPKPIIVAPAGNYIYTSEDGAVFTEYELPVASSWSCCGYGDGKYFLMSSGVTTTMLVSEDGINWTQQLKDPISSVYGITYSKELYRWVIADRLNQGTYRYGYSING